MPVVVTGMIGSETHVVGNRILSMALEQAGYKVVSPLLRHLRQERDTHSTGDALLARQ